MIKLDKIIKIYNPKKANEYEALHGVSCEISDGEMVAIIGKSGAGKSTLMNIITDNLKATSGLVRFDGEDITKMDADFRKILGFMPQQQGI